MGLMSFFVRLGLDTTQFKSGLITAQSAGQKFSRDIKNDIGAGIASAFAVGSVVAFSKSVINAADEVGDLSEQLNITTEDVQKLQILANQTGVSFEKMSSAILKVNEARKKAIEDEGQERAAFSTLGIPMSSLMDGNVTNLELVRQIGQAYRDGEKSLAAQSAVADLLGVKLMTAANAVADINNLEKIDIISDQDLKKLGEFNDRLDEMERKLKVAAAPRLSWLARSVEATAEMMATMNRMLSSDDEMKGNLATRAVSLAAAPFIAAFAGVAEAVSPTIDEAAAASGAANQRLNIPFEGPRPEDGGPIRRGIGRLQASSDPLQRIGGFTAFGTAQDRTARELAMQTRILRVIERATVTTAREMSD